MSFYKNLVFCKICRLGGIRTHTKSLLRRHCLPIACIPAILSIGWDSNPQKPDSKSDPSTSCSTDRNCGVGRTRTFIDLLLCDGFTDH